MRWERSRAQLWFWQWCRMRLSGIKRRSCSRCWQALQGCWARLAVHFWGATLAKGQRLLLVCLSHLFFSCLCPCFCLHPPSCAPSHSFSKMIRTLSWVFSLETNSRRMMIPPHQHWIQSLRSWLAPFSLPASFWAAVLVIDPSLHLVCLDLPPYVLPSLPPLVSVDLPPSFPLSLGVPGPPSLPPPLLYQLHLFS